MNKEHPLVYLAFSSAISCTYQTAKMVEQKIKEEHPEAPIHVIDLKCASLGYGLAVLRAAKLAQEGATSEEIMEMAVYHAEHMEHIFTVDDLVCLCCGRRGSEKCACIVSRLNIKI